MSDVIAQWLEKLGLSKYSQLFIDNEVDFDTVRDLTEDDLRDLGLPLGPRKKLLRALSQLADDTKSTISPAPATQAESHIDVVGQTVGAERRHMTVMFCDLVGSTEHATSLDPEDMHALLAAFQETCGSIATKHGGHVAKMLGDGLLIYFGFPRAQEDDAERAVRAALAITDAVGHINTLDHTNLQSRIGIASGVVVIGDILSSGGTDTAAASGTVPHLAARLESIASPNTVLIAESTRQLVGELFELERKEDLALKGFGQPVVAFAVVGAADVESRFAATRNAESKAFVGREHELGMLLDAWSAAVDSEGQAVLISGDAGIGKSRLLDEFCKSVASQTRARLHYQCSPQHTHSPLYPIVTHLRRTAKIALTDDANQQAENLEKHIRQGVSQIDTIAPVFAELLGIKARERYGDSTYSPERFKALVFDALLNLFEGLAAQQALLIVFEDLHWADPLTSELLSTLVARSKRSPTLVIATTRPQKEPSWVELGHTTHLKLSRIRRRGAIAIAQAAAGSALPQDVLDEILDRAEGNPLFLEEITRSLVEFGVTEHSKTSHVIPATLHDSLISRLDRLSTEKDVAQIASVIGRSFDLDLLVQTSRRPKKTVQEALKKLQDAEILYATPGEGRESYEFKHALIRDAAYESLTRTTRTHYHRVIAEYLGNERVNVVDTDPGLIAHHFIAAGDELNALDYLYLAGRSAYSRFALSEAAANLEQGLAILAKHPLAENRELVEVRFQAMLGAVLNARDGYGAQSTTDAYERAYSLLPHVTDLILKEQVLNGLYAALHNRGEFHRGEAIAVEKLKNAQAAGKPELLSSAHRTLSSVNLMKGNFRNSLEHGRKAVESFQPQSDKASQALAPHNYGVASLVHSGLPFWHAGEVRRSKSAFSDALRLARRSEHPNTICYALAWIGLAGSFMMRDYRASVTYAQEMADLGSTYGMALWTIFPLPWFALDDLLNDRPDEALKVLEAGRLRLSGFQEYWLMPVYFAIAAEALIQQGRSADSMMEVDKGLALAKRTGEMWLNSELHRLKGEAALLQHPEGDNGVFECFQSAMQLARKQGSKMFELRASVSLATSSMEQADKLGVLGRISALFAEIDAEDTCWDIQRAKACLAADG